MFIHYHLHFQCGFQNASSLPGNLAMHLSDTSAYFYQSTSVTGLELQFFPMFYFQFLALPGGCKQLCTLCHCPRPREAERGGGKGLLPDRVTLKTRAIKTPRTSCKEKGLLLGVFVLAQFLLPSRNMECKRVIHLSVFGFMKKAGILFCFSLVLVWKDR